jgi:transmembrane sensor
MASASATIGRPGELAEVDLSDGSHLVLAGDSRFETTYSKNERRLALERGEVFLSVKRDADRPFVVFSKGYRVLVVGTRFSVRLDRERLRVAVLEGRVRVEAQDPATTSSELLTAGSVAYVGVRGMEVQKGAVDAVEDLLSWRHNLLVFKDTPLSEAVAEFNRFNVHKLIVTDPTLGSMPIGGRFKLANPEAFVRLLEQGFGIKATREGNETLLSAG